MIIATAPGRCALAGDPTDSHGGSVLACATQERARCTLRPAAGGITLSAFGQTRAVKTAADLALGGGGFMDTARAVLTALEVVPGETPPFHLAAETDIPAPAGLAGTTALLAAVTGCVLAHLELRLDPYETAELIRKIDADILGTVCGFQDHYMAVFGGIRFLDFRDKDGSRPQEPPSPFAVAESLGRFTDGLPLVLAYTPEQMPPPAPETWERGRASEPAAVEGIAEIARLARRGKRALLARHWDVLAAFMNRNHTLCRDLTADDRGDDALVAAALAGGATGAKRAGPDGNAVLALTTDRERTAQTLRDCGAIVLHDPCPSPGLSVSVEVTV